MFTAVAPGSKRPISAKNQLQESHSEPVCSDNIPDSLTTCPTLVS